MKKFFAALMSALTLLGSVPSSVFAVADEADLLENKGLRTAYIFYETEMGLVQDISSPFSFVSGDTHRLPTYADAAPYAPEGSVPVSVLVGEKQEKLGALYTFGDEDGDGIVIRPVYGFREEEIIFEDTFEDYDENTSVVSGGAAPTYHVVPVKGVSDDFADYADCFAYRNVSFPDIRILTDKSRANKAMLMDMWYGDPVSFGVKLAGCDTASMSFDVPGAYRVSVDVYVPSVIGQTRTQYECEGASNAAALAGRSISLRADLAGKESYAVKSLPVTSAILDSWQTLSVDFTLAAGQTLTQVMLYTTGAHAQFYADNVRFSRITKSANIYLDPAGTVPAAGSPLTFSAGNTLTLPTYEELLPYAPAHTVPLGYVIGGRFFAPGAVYTFRASDMNGLAIVPSFGVPTKPDFGDLVMNVDFEEIAAGTALVWGGAAPQYAGLPLDQSVSAAYPALADVLSMHSSDSFAGMTVKNDFTGKNRALHIENWYEASATQSAVRISAADGKPIGFAKEGSYSASVSVYVPSSIRQGAFTSGSNKNLLGKSIRFRVETTDGAVTETHDASYTVDGTNIDTWQTLTVRFMLGKGESISRFVASVTSLSCEFYLDNFKLYYNDNSVAYRKCTVYTDAARASSAVSYCRSGDVIELPDESELTDLDPAKRVFLGFKCGDTLYAAGSSVTVTGDMEELTFVPEYRELYDAAYGELVAFEDFSAFAVGSDPSSHAFTWKASDFPITVGFGIDYSATHTVVDKGGSKALKIAKADTAWQWPQLGVTLSKPLTDGEYTMVCDVTYPAAGNGVSGAAVRAVITNGSGETVNGDVSTSFAANANAKIVNTRVVDGTTCRSINSYLLFISCDNKTPGSYYEINSVSLYARRSRAVFTVSDSASYGVGFVPGDAIGLPSRFDVLRLVPEGKRAVGFKKDGVTYGFGDTYQTAPSDMSLDFDVVLEDVTHTVAFSLDGENGTVADILVSDGGIVTLPAPPAALADNFDGWQIPALGTQTAGTAFTYDDAAFAALCDADGRFTVKAAWKNAPTTGEPVICRAPTDTMFAGATQAQTELLASAYGTGVYPACDTFDGNAAVSGRKLIRAATSLYNVFYGTLNVTTDAAVRAFAAEKGVLPETFDETETMTVADAALLLANAMPDNRYSVINGQIALEGNTASETAALTKLARAGILPGDVSAADTLTEDILLDMLARCVDESRRTTSAKRTVWILGDSLCAGEGSPSHTGWARKLPAMLGEDCNVVNLAIGGLDTNGFLSDTGEGYKNYLTAMNGARPGDYIFIALGTNDATLWMWKDHPEIGQGWSMSFEQSLANYRRYAADARALGCVPVFICPVSRNIDNADNKNNPYYLAYDARIIECMEKANEGLTNPAPIVNFKTVSDVRINEEMTPSERAKLYYDGVHYTDHGAGVVCGIFRDIVMADDTVSLAALRTHLTDTEPLPCDVTAELAVSAASLSEDGSFTVEAYADASLDGTDAEAVVAFYDKDGRLTQAKTAQIRIGEGKNVIPASDVLPGFDTVRVMLFRDTETLKPVSNAANAQ